MTNKRPDEWLDEYKRQTSLGTKGPWLWTVLEVVLIIVILVFMLSGCETKRQQMMRERVDFGTVTTVKMTSDNNFLDDEWTITTTKGTVTFRSADFGLSIVKGKIKGRRLYLLGSGKFYVDGFNEDKEYSLGVSFELHEEELK